jgi:alkaline phosphatase
MESGQKYLSSVIADVFLPELMELTGVGWTSHQHTAEPVVFLASGPGADAIPDFFENHRLNAYLRTALGLNA